MISKTTVHGDCVIHHPTKKSPGYSISYVHGGWMPGIYDSIESAIKGFECCIIDECRFVEEIQKPINHFDKGNIFISVADMESFIDYSKEGIK